MNAPKVLLSAVLLSAAAFPIELKAQEQSAFGVFKAFCIDTDLDKTAMNEKAASLGALPLKLPENELSDVLAGMAGARRNKAAWSVQLGGRQVIVYFTASDLPPPSEGAQHRDICHVVFRDDDPQVMDDFNRWVRLPDSEAIRQPALGETSFEFEVIDGKHVPLPKAWRVDPAYSKRVTWSAEISYWHTLNLSLERTKPF